MRQRERSSWLLRRGLQTVLPVFLTGRLIAQTVTVSGTVRDTISLTPLPDATVELINIADPAERHMVTTDPAGNWAYTLEITGAGSPQELPTTLSLRQNYPNPFNPSTMIRFSVPVAGVLRISVHTILGQELDVRSEVLGPGEYQVEWVGTGGAGVLFYSIEMNGRRVTRRMTQLDGGVGGGLGEVRFLHSLARVSSATTTGSREYRVIASRLDYEPDTTSVLLLGAPRVDFLLESIHRRAFLIDLHNDVMEPVMDGYQLGPRHTYNHSDLPRFREGGVDAQMYSIWADPYRYGANPYSRSIAMMNAFDQQVSLNADVFGHAQTVGQMDSLRALGKHAGILAIEGGGAIEDDLTKLITFSERGVRCMTITWNYSTSWAVAAKDPLSTTQGLSEFGRQVIRLMDSLGIIIDVSHTGIQTIKDILATTTNPIIASHSGARTLRDHFRNLYDDQIRSIAQRGGVIGVVFYPWFLSSTGTASIDSVVLHIDYIKNLVGIDYIALGSDFDGIEVVPSGLEDVSRFPELTRALLRRGYSRAEVRKILGENFLRVFNEVCHE